VDNRDPRDRNNEAAFAAVTAWCVLKNVDPVPVLDRLALALVTESSGGYIFANDGSSFPLDSAVCRVLRRSLDLPHDRVGHDSRSTGTLQQMSLEANQSMVPPLSWGWGAMAETMSPARAAVMFVEALQVTNTSTYLTPAGVLIDCGDPIVADVLRTQRPAVGTTLPPNYRASQVDLAKRMARGGPRFWTDGG
jgi:hypothetical protein